MQQQEVWNYMKIHDNATFFSSLCFCRFLMIVMRGRDTSCHSHVSCHCLFKHIFIAWLFHLTHKVLLLSVQTKKFSLKIKIIEYYINWSYTKRLETRSRRSKRVFYVKKQIPSKLLLLLLLRLRNFHCPSTVLIAF